MPQRMKVQIPSFLPDVFLSNGITMGQKEHSLCYILPFCNACDNHLCLLYESTMSFMMGPSMFLLQPHHMDIHSANHG